MQATLKYYKSADTLPIYNFIKCKSGELQYLYKCDVDEVPESFPESFHEAFMNVIFSLTNIDTSLIRMKEQAAKYENLYATTKNKKWLNKKNLKEYEIKVKIESSEGEGEDFFTQVAQVSRILKIDINVFKCPTNQYFGKVEDIKNMNNG